MQVKGWDAERCTQITESYTLHLTPSDLIDPAKFKANRNSNLPFLR